MNNLGMNNLAIITTPGHYFNVLECIEQLNIDKKDTELILFSFDFDKRSNAFFDEIEQRDAWKKTHRVSLWNRNNPAISTLENTAAITKFMFKFAGFVGKSFNTVLVNQIDTAYHRLILRIINFERVISLDEGNAIIHLIRL